MNPGATEFTPRSLAIAQKCVTSNSEELSAPTKKPDQDILAGPKSWADDVETHILPANATADQESTLKKENNKPDATSPVVPTIVTAYRHFEPLSSSRSASDPVVAPADKVSPPASQISKEDAKIVSSNVLRNKVNTNTADRQSQRGRGRGGRNRGGRYHGVTKRTNRSASSPSKANK